MQVVEIEMRPDVIVCCVIAASADWVSRETPVAHDVGIRRNASELGATLGE